MVPLTRSLRDKSDSCLVRPPSAWALLIHFRPLPNVLECTFSDVGRRVCCQVDEQDHTPVSVEIRKGDDVGEGVEGKAPIKHGANGDVEGATSGGFEGADLDPADQTLVEGVSQDADTSAIQEFTVSPA